MPYRYRNVDTGQVVERRERDPWLDRNAHRWERTGGAREIGTVTATVPIEAPRAGNRLLTSSAPAAEPEPVDEQPTRPGDRASRAAWGLYAASRASTPAEQAEVEGMTRAQLIERYGAR